MQMSYLLLQSSGGTVQLLFFAAMFLIFWLFLIRPQTKRQKEQRNFSDALEKGDEVVTASGILGKITKMEENIITIEVGNKVYLRVTKSSVSKEMTDAVYNSGDKK